MYYHNHYGGYFGYCLRRSIHISMSGIPFIYYWYGNTIANVIQFEKNILLVLLVAIVLALEFFRLVSKMIIIGQRPYEAKQISAAAWGVVAIACVLIFSPQVGLKGAAIGAPLIWCLSIADPIIGEARRRRVSNQCILLLGLLCVALIWSVSNFYLQGPWFLMPFIVPLTVASEMIKFRWIDDNATMLLIPLIVILVIYTLHP